MEVKFGQTIHDDFFKGLRYFSKVSGSGAKSGLVIGRELFESRSEHIISGYNTIYRLYDELTE